jgi:alkylated DNA repair dioxygenase AlkB
VEYIPGYVPKEIADAEFERLWNTIDWERRDGAPRREYWQNDYDLPYTYGSGNGVRTYEAKPWDAFVDLCRQQQNSENGWKLDCCFINGYETEKDALGWHADDSPEMNPEQPVTVISLGEERNIMFRPVGSKDPTEIQTVRLGHGSLLIMPPGFQQTHQHKIPKGDRQGMRPRISLTYRGMILD